MLTILTGTPGNGKTAHALDMCWFIETTIWHGLDKYVDGVAELKLDHFEFPDIKDLKRPDYVPLAKVDSDEYAVWLPDNPHYAEFVQARATAKTAFDLWFLWATPRSVVIVDEAQRYMRPRPAGSPVPLSIQMLEYHRHFGIHMLFITQKERLLHTNVRMLAGQHIHLTDGWRGRHRFEWPECKDTESKSEKAVAAHKDYKLPKHVFPYYKSTVENLSTKHGKPLYAYALPAMFILVPVLVFAAGYHYKKNFLDKPVPVAATSTKAQSGQIADSSGAVPASGVPVAASMDAMKKFMPAIVGRPETAPAYDHLRQVVAMPVISACLQSQAHCYCYTQQGTRIADMDEATCRQYLDQGQQFNPYVQPVQSAQNTPASGFSGFGKGGGSTVEQRLVMEPVTASELGHMVALR